MNQITIEIKDLTTVNNELSDIDDSLLRSLSGSGLLTAVGAAFTATLGVGINGLYYGQSTKSILEQQVIYGGTAFIGGFLIPSP